VENCIIFSQEEGRGGFERKELILTMFRYVTLTPQVSESPRGEGRNKREMFCIRKERIGGYSKAKSQGSDKQSAENKGAGEKGALHVSCNWGGGGATPRPGKWNAAGDKRRD